MFRAIVLTISDTRKDSDDISGENLVKLLAENNFEVIKKVIVPDEIDQISDTLISIVEKDKVNLILTTGGTGFAPRDNTPEATLAVIEKETPGISEAMRFETAKATKFAMLSRGVSGIKDKTLIINMPGSPKGVLECFDVIKDILPHALKLIAGDTKH